MSRLSIEQLVTTPAALNYLSESAYDYTKWNLGKSIIYNAGVTAIDKYIAPDFGIFRPMEESTAFATNQIFSYSLNSTTSYIFGIENSTTASNTRRIHSWVINRKTGAKSWNGFITITLASATAHTVRDFKIDVKTESTGTVATTGTALTGTGTAFVTNKVAIGARIGFGSTDPGLINTWYRISVRTSDTALTLATSPGNITAGTAYVIQEFRPVYTATNATTTNSGIHYAKGVSLEDFTPAGTTIALAVSTDDQKAVYWLKDAAVQTQFVASGAACDFASATPTSLDTYVLDLVSAGNHRVFKYNIRAALTVASGASVSAWVLTTGTQAITGTGSQNANLAIASASHGLGSGVKSLYFVSTTRFYRAATANITSGNITWLSDNITEIPPGGTSTYPATGALSTLEYMDSIDTFIIGTTHVAGAQSYVTKYVASGQRFDKMFGRDFRYLEQSLKDANAPSFFSNQATVFSFSDAGTNRIFAVKQGTAISTNHIYIMAFGADWDYAINSSGRLISPEITTVNALRYYRVLANEVPYLGDTALGKTTEAFRIYARTANIRVDVSSGWTLLDNTNDISGFAGAASIQFAVEFRTIGESCLPARILGLNLSYEDNTTDSHYSIAIEKSSVSSKIFAWWFNTAFGGTVPTLTVRLYDADTGGLLLTDTTTTGASGTFQKATDGVTWTAYNDTDRANNTTWIRYTPTSLADNIKVQAYITQG